MQRQGDLAAASSGQLGILSDERNYIDAPPEVILSLEIEVFPVAGAEAQSGKGGGLVPEAGDVGRVVCAGQKETSLARGMSRRSINPHFCRDSGGKRRLRKGMEIQTI